MNKQELIEFLKENLTIKIDTEKVRGNHYEYSGDKRLKVSIMINEEEIDYDYINKDDLEFINKSI